MVGRLSVGNGDFQFAATRWALNRSYQASLLSVCLWRSDLIFVTWVWTLFITNFLYNELFSHSLKVRYKRSLSVYTYYIYEVWHERKFYPIRNTIEWQCHLISTIRTENAFIRNQIYLSSTECGHAWAQTQPTKKAWFVTVIILLMWRTLGVANAVKGAQYHRYRNISDCQKSNLGKEERGSAFPAPLPRPPSAITSLVVSFICSWH